MVEAELQQQTDDEKFMDLYRESLTFQRREAEFFKH